MARLFGEPRLVVASHNEGKVREIRDLLAPLGRSVVSAKELNLSEPDETGDTFVANALLKGRAAVAGSGITSLADDSGIEVAALNGDPGIYTARWAGPDRDFMVAMSRVNKAMGDAADRRANFTAVLAMCWPDGHCETFEGKVFGTLVWPPRGEKGFGFDPMFVPDGYDVTFSEMDPAIKHTISHRAVAFKKLMDTCFSGRA